jgi:hypothetical protein
LHLLLLLLLQEQKNQLHLQHQLLLVAAVPLLPLRVLLGAQLLPWPAGTAAIHAQQMT